MPLNMQNKNALLEMLLGQQNQMHSPAVQQPTLQEQPAPVPEQAAPPVEEIAPAQTSTPNNDVQAVLQNLMAGGTSADAAGLPSQSPKNQQRLQEILKQQRAKTDTMNKLAASGEEARSNIMESAEQAKAANKERVAVKQEGLTLYQRQQIEKAEALKDDMIRLNGINDTESQTLYDQALQNKERADAYANEQAAILSDPNASVFAKIGASFKQYAFAKPEQQAAHNTLAGIRRDRLAAVQDYYNEEAIVTKNFEINNAADIANLKVREETANNAVAMYKDNISLDSNVLSGISASMGLQGSAATQLNKELQTLASIDQFNKDAVTHAMYKAQSAQAMENLTKAEKEAKNLDDYYTRNEEVYQEFASTNRDPTLSGLTFKQFMEQERAAEVKTGRPTRAMESFAIYKSNQSTPSDKPATALLNQYASGEFDPNDPAIKEQTRVDLALLQKSIDIKNGDITAANKSAPPDKQQPLMSLNTLTPEQAASLDSIMVKERGALGNDITPLMRGGSLVISDIDGMLKAAQTNSGLQAVIAQVLTPEEQKLISSGEMKDVVTMIAPDNPQGSVRASVESAMNKILNDPELTNAQRNAKMKQYAEIFAKRSEVERKLAKKRGVPGLQDMPIGQVSLFTTGTLQFRLDNPSNWHSLMQSYQVKQAQPMKSIEALRIN